MGRAKAGGGGLEVVLDGRGKKLDVDVPESGETGLYACSGSTPVRVDTLARAVPSASRRALFFGGSPVRC